LARPLGAFEFGILQELINRPNDAYGASLQERLSQTKGSEISIGAIYTSLDRLERKGFVSSWWGEATAERGGRRKRYYRIEGSGREAVRHTAAIYAGSQVLGHAMGVA
jgi:PadR family transcriptional regulator, regulatory protein PadR